VQRLNQALCSYQTFVQVDSEVLQNHPLRQAAKTLEADAPLHGLMAVCCHPATISCLLTSNGSAFKNWKNVKPGKNKEGQLLSLKK